MLDSDDDTLEFFSAVERGRRFFAGRAIPVHVKFGAASHAGKVRPVNQDHFAVVERRRSRQVLLTNLDPKFLHLPNDEAYVMIVADGMGGAASGELASSLAIRTAWDLTNRITKWVMRMNEDEPPEVRERVDTLVHMINRVLRDRAAENPQLAGMGTTLTAVYTMGPDAVISHVGDSRAYHYRKGHLKQLTHDHTLAQEMLDAGADESETIGYRHILTNCLGGGSDHVTADITFTTLEDQDGLLLCSDGLTLHVSDDEIRKVLNEHDVPQAACDALVRLALDRGGKDNVTVVLARYTILEAACSQSDEDTAPLSS